MWTAIYNYWRWIGVGFENTWTTNLDYNYYILRHLVFKILRLRIWISIVIYLTGLDLKVLGLRIWIMTNLDFTGFELGNT